MKKTLLILLLFRCLFLTAQIRISDFELSVSDGSAMDVRTSVKDPDGRLCPVLKIETKQNGWTFDAGLDGIVDIRYGEGVIWIYVPSSARKLTIAHNIYGVLRDWNFPLTLESGMTYTMKLSYDRPRQGSMTQRFISSSAPAGTTRSRQVTPHLPSAVTESNSSIYTVHRSDKAFCSHFVDFYLGFSCSKDFEGGYEFDDLTWFGLSYTWVGNRVGPYLSLAVNTDECFSALGGVALRLTDPRTASLDWQLYGGAGLIDENLGFDFGSRFAWRTSHRLSHWDFGFGCQFSGESIIPTVSVGLYIWGIPTVVSLGLLCGV